MATRPFKELVEEVQATWTPEVWAVHEAASKMLAADPNNVYVPETDVKND